MAAKRSKKAKGVSGEEKVLSANTPVVLADTPDYYIEPAEGSVIGDSEWSEIVIALNIPSGVVSPSRSTALSMTSLTSSITGNSLYSSRDFSTELNAEGYATRLIWTYVDAKDESSFGECEFQLVANALQTPDGDRPFGTITVRYYYHQAPTSAIPLTDGDGVVTGYASAGPAEGTGDGVVSFTADECEGLDREGVATWTANGCADVERKVFQLGLREKFTDDDFMVADGGTFHVLKDEKVLNNYYEFVGSDEGDSVVTIDGMNVTVPAGATVKGYFADDISAVPTNNLKKIKIIGDVSLFIGSSGDNDNYTLEDVEVDFSVGYSRSLQYFLRREGALERTTISRSSPTSLASCFAYCPSLRTVTFRDFDTSKVTTMQSMFYGCNALTSVDVSNFDTSKVTTMRSMFTSCYALTSVDVSNFNTSACTDMSYMFYGCNALTSVDVSNFDTSKVTTMYCMFYNCYALTSVDVSNFNTSKVTTMRSMFTSCYALTELDLSSFDTSKVTTMYQMFYQCYALTALDLSSFDTSACTSMYNMFNQCYALTALDVSSFDTSQVTTMQYMFNACTSLERLSLGDKWDMSKVENCGSWFGQDSKLTTVTGTISNIMISASLSVCPLTRESALVFINGLSNSPRENNPTLTLSSMTKGYLTNEDIAIATDKGWTIA